MSMTTKNFSASVQTIREIEAEAKRKNCSVSEVIRQALDFYLGHRSIEGTVRSEIAKVDAGIHSILKSLLVFAAALDEASPMKPIIAAKIGEQATDDLIRKIESMRGAK